MARAEPAPVSPVERAGRGLVGVALLAHAVANVAVRWPVLARGELITPPSGGDPVATWLAEAAAFGLTGALLLVGHRWAVFFGAGALALVAVAILDSHCGTFSRWGTMNPGFHRAALTSWLPWTLEAGIAAVLAILLGARARHELRARGRELPADAEPVTLRHYLAAAPVALALFIALVKLLMLPWRSDPLPDRPWFEALGAVILVAAVPVLVLWCVWTGLRHGSPLARWVVAWTLISEPAYRLLTRVSGAPWLDPGGRDMAETNALVGVPFLVWGIVLCLPRRPRPPLIAAAH